MDNELTVGTELQTNTASSPPLWFSSGGVWNRDETYLVKRRNYTIYLLLYTIGGEGLLAYEGQEHRLLPGTAFLIDCQKDHLYRTVHDHWKFIFIHFDTDLLRGYVDGLYKNYGPVFRPSDGNALESRMRATLSLFYGPNASPHRTFALMTEILGMLYVAAEEADKTTRISRMTDSVLQVVKKRYADKLTLDDIAQQVQYSKYYLAHHFKKDIGISVHEYLTLFRISQSKLLLLNTNLSVADISSQTGFSSAGSFIRTFSEYETVTPHQYRKQRQ